MTNKVIAGAFAVILGGMAVKVFKTITNNKEETDKEIVEDELQD